MNWIVSIAKALNPCVHMWKTLDTLKDNPTDPQHLVVIQECDICGETRQLNFDGPGRPPPSRNCKHDGHKFETFEKIHLIDSNDKWVDDAGKAHSSSKGYKLLQQCKYCGDTRTEVVGLSPANYKGFGLDPPKGAHKK